MEERQLIDTLEKVGILSHEIISALDKKEFLHAESVLSERLELLKTIPPLQTLNLSNTVFEQAAKMLNDIEYTDSLGLKNAYVQQKEIQTKLSAGVKAQKAILTYLDHKV